MGVCVCRCVSGCVVMVNPHPLDFPFLADAINVGMRCRLEWSAFQTHPESAASRDQHTDSLRQAVLSESRCSK